jgi:hypothetical protein
MHFDSQVLPGRPEGKGLRVLLPHPPQLPDDSYSIEGPRGDLEFDHNYVHVEKLGGRIYSHHGAKSKGPMRIHHNVVENVDMSLVWMNEGLVKNMLVFNNTIFCADAGRRSGNLLDAWTAERLNNWQFKKHIAVAAWSRPRQVHPMERGVPEKITVTHNLFVNFQNVPEGNFEGELPGLKRFADSIGLTGYGWDLHYLESAGGLLNRKPPVCQIPFRIMVPKPIENLICPGRAVSVERDILGPYRVMASCMAMGEAAGLAAAQVVERSSAFGEIDIKRLQDQLRKHDAILEWPV